MSTDQLVYPATWLTLLDLLRWRASSQSERRAYTFLLDGETEEVHITYGELDRRARAIGALLQQHVAPGDRALLLYPPGLDYIAAFFGCMYAAVIAVPVYPPNPARPARTLPRLHDITLDARPAAILTTSSFLSVSAKFATQGLHNRVDGLQALSLDLDRALYRNFPQMILFILVAPRATTASPAEQGNVVTTPHSYRPGASW